MAVLMAGQAERAGSRQIAAHLALVGGVLAAILLVRVSSLFDTTAFFDEALYIMIGRRILGHIPDYPAIRWITGSYLYPLVAAQASLVFDSGLYGARLVSALSITGAAGGIYLLTERLLNRAAAFIAMILFGFAGVTLLVGALATYDSLGVACLTATVVLLQRGYTATARDQQRRYVLLAGTAFACSVLSKYVALFFGPVIVLLLVLSVIRPGQWRRGVILLGTFALPVVLILGGYVIAFFADLQVMAAVVQTLTSQPAPRSEILREIAHSLIVCGVLAVVGSRYLLHSPQRTARAALLLFWSAAAVFPAYHLLTANIRSLDKHMAYTLIFLAPLAGGGVLQIFDFIQQKVRAQAGQIAAITGCIGLLMLALQTEHDLGWWLLHNWPDKQATLAYLRTVPVSKDTHILAEGSDVYTFHLGWEGHADVISTWHTGFPYGGKIGADAMQAALADRYFQYLIVDGYYTPELSTQLKQAAQAAGYHRVFYHADPLSSGLPVLTEIYAADRIADPGAPPTLAP